MNISEVTRRDIIDFLLKDSDVFHGRLELLSFLERVWDLNSMPSTDRRYNNVAGDIWQHMVNNNDYTCHDLLYDILNITICDDEIFLKFLEQCVHPLVISDSEEVTALNNRHSGRKSFEITDEYDVQDLFYALQLPFFEDIRDEEVTPSHTGGYSRMDFLIKSENIVVEVKKTRPTLKANDVGDQLIIDNNRYRNHPNCKTFIAFVYDPDGYIKNPRGFERDLSCSTDGMRVKVIIAPS